MPKSDADTSHPPVSNRKRAKSKFEKAKALQEDRVRECFLGSTLTTSEGAASISEDATRTENVDDAGIEQPLGDDGDDSTLAISRNESAEKPSGGDSDGDFAAKREVLDLNRRDDGRSPLALNQFDPPKPPDSTVQTNVLPPLSSGVVYLCKISCKPAAMPAQQKRMLIKEFLHHLNVTPCLGQLFFLNGCTFLTKDSCLRTPLIKNLLLGSFSRRTSRVDEKSKLIRNGSESFWSNLYHGRLNQKPHVLSKVPVSDTYDNSEPFEASASCTVETIDFSNFCGPKRHQGTRDLKKYVSDFNNLYFPGPPNIVPDAPEREQIIVHGNKTFDFRQAGYSLGFGLEVRNGALLIVRATEKGLVRVVSPCQRVFFAPMKASSFMTAHWSDYALDPIKASADFDSVLRGLCVVVQQANGVKRRAIVSEVLRTCPSDTVFEVVDRGVQSRTTVEEYFSRRHGIALTDLTLPCLNVGSKKRPQYFPSSMCHILPCQSFRKKMPIQATVNLHRFKRRLLSTFEQNHSSKSDDRAFFAQSVDLIESTNIIKSPPDGKSGTLLLDHSRIPYETLYNPSRPQPFKLSDYKLSFLVVFAEIGNAPAMSAQVGLLVSILKAKLESSGNSHVIRSSETCKLKLSEEEEVWRRTLEERTGRDLNNPSEYEGHSNYQPPMVIAMIDGDNRNKEAYETVKSYLNVNHGFQCTCVNLSTLEKAHKKDPDSGIDKYASSLLRKILAKANAQPIVQLESTERNSHQGAKPQHKTLLVGFHVVRLPPRSEFVDENEDRLLHEFVDENEDRPLHSLLISVATKPLGLSRPYKITTVIQNIGTIDELDLSKVLETHVRRVEREFMPGSYSRILVFRSGFCELPVMDEDPSPPQACRDDNIRTEVERFQELSHSKTFGDVNIIYVTIEKPLKLKIFKKGDSHPQNSRKPQNGPEISPKCFVMQEGVSHPEDCELFFMKETRGDASHYPLRVRVRSGGSGDVGLGWKGKVERKTIEEISQATYDYPSGVDSVTLPAPIYFARRACKRALLFTPQHARTFPNDKHYSVIDVNRNLKNTLHYL